MKRSKHFNLIIALIITLIFIGIIVVRIRINSISYFEHDIYYISTVDNTLKSTKSRINNDSKDLEILEIYNSMVNIPETVTQLSSIPSTENVLIYDYEIIDETLYIYLTQEINELTSIEKIYFESSIVWTFTGLDYIKEIAFGLLDSDNRIINSNNIYYSDRNEIRVNPVIAPEKIITHEITLYFPDKKTRELKKETRSINYNSDKLIASYILEQTIIGPLDSNNESYIPPSTQINGVRIEDKICYVDLSGDFIDNNLLVYEQWLSVYSIVYSLVELEEIESVQLLIDSKKYDIYGNVDLSKPL